MKRLARIFHHQFRRSLEERRSAEGGALRRAMRHARKPWRAHITSRDLIIDAIDIHSQVDDALLQLSRTSPGDAPDSGALNRPRVSRRWTPASFRPDHHNLEASRDEDTFAFLARGHARSLNTLRRP